MIRDIPRPEISPDFTVKDIHKIREWDYEQLRDATPEERRADTERRAAPLRNCADRRWPRCSRLYEQICIKP